MDSILPFFLLDLAVVATVIVVMARRMSFWHPLTVYLLFHCYSFTYRTFKILGGSPLMYTGQANAEAITPEEITRALLWADVGLLIFAAASWWAHRVFEARSHEPVERKILNPNIARFIGVLCLPIGAYVFFSLKTSALTVTADSASAGYLQAISMWPIGVIGLLVFVFGFRSYLLLLAGLFLGIVALQGYHRFMLILPLLYLTAVYLQNSRQKWPNTLLLMAALAVGLVFPSLKGIGASIQYGDYNNAVELVKESFVKSEKDQEPSVGEDFLDQFAGGLSLADTNDRKFWGSTYLAIITLPIPRAWWPDKPGLADHLQEISTSGRRYDVEGRIVTYLGESYLNFGYAGLLLIPALLGYVLTAFCLHATSGPMLRLGRYVYLVAFMAMVQMFRDGLLSIFVFTFVHNMPMLFTLILHHIPGLADKALDRPPADPLALEEEDGRGPEAQRLG